MSANSRMERYHSTREAPTPQPQASQPYRRRPALARWVALLIALLTLTVGLKLTVFNASYTAGVVSRSSTGEKVMNRVNNGLTDLGISGDPVSATLIQPYLAQGIAQLYGQSTATVDDTALANAIQSQASSVGVTASTTLTRKLTQRVQKLATQAFTTSAMQTAATRVQWAMRLNWLVMIAVVLLSIVTVIYAAGVHHFLASLGPGLALGGGLTMVLSGLGWFVGLPMVTAALSGPVASLSTTVGQSGLGVILFAGAAEVVLGFLVLLGHRTFRRS